MQKPISIKFNYISIITLYMGMLNAYAYYNYNGFLISMQSGNLAKIGIYLYQLEFKMLFSTLNIILGCLIGIILIHLINYFYYKDKDLYIYRNFCLILNIILLIVFSIFANGISNDLGIFFLAMISSIHLYNVHNYYHAIHGVSAVSSNVKNLGIFIGDAIIMRKRRYIIVALKYFILFMLFSVGSFIGSFLCDYLGYYSIYIIIGILIILYVYIRKEDNNINSKGEIIIIN